MSLESLPEDEAGRVMGWVCANYPAHEYAALRVEEGELVFVWRKYDDPGADNPVLMEQDQVKVEVAKVLADTPRAPAKAKKVAKKPAKKKAK